jgi:hypothetical protein
MTTSVNRIQVTKDQSKMTERSAIERLKAYLNGHTGGTELDAGCVGSLLSGCWSALNGGGATNMKADKLHRIETPSWNPPFLEFSIERHGQTVNGSSRATLYRWRVNLEKCTADIIDEKRTQLYPMDKRLDVKPIAESLADAIIHGRQDGRIIIGKDGSLRLKIGEIVPETNQQTTAARRKRLRIHLLTLLAPHGWKERRANVYYRSQTAAQPISASKSLPRGVRTSSIRCATPSCRRRGLRICGGIDHDAVGR